MKRRIVILGPPGGGKGTHAKRLVEELGIIHVSSGAILRDEVERASDMGRRVKQAVEAGDLVPDDIVIDLAISRLRRAGEATGWILDGFPRDLDQARLLEERFEEGPQIVIALEVPENELVERVTGRRTCPNGHIYHLRFHPPRRDGACDIDGLELTARSDDTAEVVRNRLEVYRRETTPLIGFYGERDLSAPVDGSGQLDVVYARVRATLDRGPSQPG